MSLARLLVALWALGSLAHAQKLTPKQIIDKVMETDSWGLGDAEVTARAVSRDPRGSQRELAFSGRSRRYDGLLTKSLVRFSAPADIAGTGFLQIQKKNADDDRFLFLPELKKSRRIAGAGRANAFMSTDFSFGDLDLALVGAVDLAGDVRNVLGRKVERPGDGAVALALERLDDARRHGRRILAVLHDLGVEQASNLGGLIEDAPEVGDIGAAGFLARLSRAARVRTRSRS